MTRARPVKHGGALISVDSYLELYTSSIVHLH